MIFNLDQYKQVTPDSYFDKGPALETCGCCEQEFEREDLEPVVSETGSFVMYLCNKCENN